MGFIKKLGSRGGFYGPLYIKSAQRGRLAYMHDDSFNSGNFPLPPPVFHAATYDPITFELQQESVGVGGETCTHTSTIYAPDYLGVYHAFGANAPVWEGGRVEDEGGIQKIYSSKYNDSLQHDLQVWYPFDEVSGTRTDSKSGQELAVTGGDVTSDTGKQGLCGVFDGASYLQGANPIAYTDTKFSISFWFNADVVNVTQFLVDTSGGSDDIYLTNSTLYVRLGVTLTSTGIIAGQWYHVAVTLNGDGSTARLYVDGDEKDTGLQTQYGWDGADLFVGVRKTLVSHFSGKIDELAFWSRALTPSEVTDLYNANAGVPYPSEATTLLDPLPMLVYQGAATNKVPASNYNDGGWTTSATVTNNSDDGIDGVSGTATKVEDTSAATQELIRSEISAVGHSLLVSGRLFIRKEVGVTSNARVVLTTSNPVSENNVISINLETGAWIPAGGPADISVTSVGSFWMICMVVEPTDPTVLDANLEIRPAHYLIDSTSGDVALLGSAVIGNLEIYPDIPLKVLERIGPIFTAGTAVSTDEIINTWAAANHSDAGDSYEITPRLTGEDQILLSMGGTAVLSVVSGDVVLSDGTNSCSTPVVSAEPHIIATYNATDDMTLDVDGVTATSAYDGTLGSGDLSTKATQRDLIRSES